MFLKCLDQFKFGPWYIKSWIYFVVVRTYFRASKGASSKNDRTEHVCNQCNQCNVNAYGWVEGGKSVSRCLSYHEGLSQIISLKVWVKLFFWKFESNYFFEGLSQNISVKVCMSQLFLWKFKLNCFSEGSSRIVSLNVWVELFLWRCESKYFSEGLSENISLKV